MFRQATSREDDPQLHSPVVIAAKVRAPEGQWRALDAHYLKGKQRAVGGLYQSVLRAELTSRYGVAWDPIVNGQAEVAGTPAELLALFSKRSAQVDAALADKLESFRGREGRDPTRRERAALTREAAADSRSAKTGAHVEDLAGRWRHEAAELGWTPARVVERLQAAARQAPLPEPVTVTGVLDQLSALGSTWTRPPASAGAQRQAMLRRPRARRDRARSLTPRGRSIPPGSMASGLAPAPCPMRHAAFEWAVERACRASRRQCLRHSSERWCRSAHALVRRHVIARRRADRSCLVSEGVGRSGRRFGVPCRRVGVVSDRLLALRQVSRRRTRELRCLR